MTGKTHKNQEANISGASTAGRKEVPMRWRRAERVAHVLIGCLAAMALSVASGTAYGWLLVQLGRAVL